MEVAGNRSVPWVIMMMMMMDDDEKVSVLGEAAGPSHPRRGLRALHPRPQVRHPTHDDDDDDDPRFVILRAGDVWTLGIREVRDTDEGSYQCQVSSVNRSGDQVKYKPTTNS